MTATREPTRADVRALAELTHRAVATYRQWARPDLPLPAPEDIELDWQIRLARADTWARVGLDERGAIVAVAAFGAARASRRDPTLLPGVAQLSALFVDPDRRRSGWGRRLLALAEREMRARGYERARLWTPEGAPAERLYARAGWAPTGRRDLHPRFGGLPLVEYAKAL